MLAGGSQDSHEQAKAAQKQAAAEKARKATPKEIQQAEVLANSTLFCAAELVLQHRVMNSLTVVTQVSPTAFVVSFCVALFAFLR